MYLVETLGEVNEIKKKKKTCLISYAHPFFHVIKRIMT